MTGYEHSRRRKEPPRMTWDGMRHTQCQWIEGEPRRDDLNKCLEPVAVEGLSWCGAHAKRVWRRVEA